MIWLPGLRRAAYLFRTPLLKSYSGRMVSRSRERILVDLRLGFFFIGLPLIAVGWACTDDPDQVAALDMRDNHEMLPIR